MTDETFDRYLESFPEARLPGAYSWEVSLYVAPNVEEAVRFAQTLRAEQGFDMFRGQRRSWRLQCSLYRDGIDQKEAGAKLAHLKRWIAATPELASIHGDDDAVTAIAQHYGLPTSMIDFSRDPAIAGEFAACGLPGPEAGHTRSDQHGLLICARSAAIREAWEQDNETMREEHGIDVVRVVEIDVKNLWRLQAQQGLFLYSRVDTDWLADVTPTVWICFPLVDPPHQESVSIYPEEKSHLELLLDHFFENEWGWRVGRKLGERAFAELETRDLGRGTVALQSKDGSATLLTTDVSLRTDAQGRVQPKPDEQVPDPHPSWSDAALAPWLSEPDERLAHAVADRELKLAVDCAGPPFEAARNLAHQIVDWLDRASDARAHALQIRAEPRAPLDLSDAKQYIRDNFADRNTRAAYLWDGMRRLPYSNPQIATALSFFLILTMSRAEEAPYDTMKAVLQDRLDVEYFSAGASGRGWASPDGVFAALRPDLGAIAKNDPTADNTGISPRGALFGVRYPQRLFDFPRFVDVYAAEVLPTSAYLRLRGDALLFNPARLDIFTHY